MARSESEHAMPGGSYQFEDFELDSGAYELRRTGRVVRIERIPLDLLFFLVERRGQLVTRQEIIERVWGKDVFVDSDTSVNTAIRKIRQALREDPDKPRLLFTVAGKGYRFVTPVAKAAPAIKEAAIPAQVDPLTAAVPKPTRYVETVPGKGYQLIAAAPEASPDTEPEPQELEPKEKTSTPPILPMLTWAGVGVVGVAAIVMLYLWQPWRTANRPLQRLSLELPGFTLPPDTMQGASLALSPDGGRVVYTVRASDGTFRLYAKALDQEQAVPLTGTEGGYAPFFSPDGKTVAFFASGSLKKIAIEHGEPVVLCNAQKGAAGGSWGDDGNIIAALGDGVLSRIPPDGSTVQPVTQLRPDKKDLAHLWPQVLPGAKAVLFTAVPTHAFVVDSTIEWQSLRTGERTTVARGGYYARYVPSGHLLYAQTGTLFAAPMDLARPALTERAKPVASDLADPTSSGFAQFDYSQTGTLAFVRGKHPEQRLGWLDSTGRIEMSRQPAAAYNPAVRFSPDGKRLAMAEIGSDGVDVWVYAWERDTMTRLTFNALAWFPIWTPDGEHIAFMSGQDGGAPNLYYMRSDGVGQPVRLTKSDSRQVPYSFSPDGKRLAFFEFNPHTKADIWTLTLEKPESDNPKVKNPEPFLATPFDERAPMISPDGRWIAYESDESGRNEVYVRSFPGPGGKWQISTAGGDRPVWSKKDPALFYRTGAGMMAASYTGSGMAFVAEKPRLWATNKDLGSYFDLAPEGKRFAILQPVKAEGGAEHVVLLQNFFDELRRSVPAGQP